MPIEFFIIVVLLGIITFGIRMSFLALASNREMNATVTVLLKYIPASVFAALSIPALIFVKSGGYEVQSMERLYASIVAAAVAYFSKNVLLTIMIGMLSLWAFKAIGI